MTRWPLLLSLVAAMPLHAETTPAPETPAAITAAQEFVSHPLAAQGAAPQAVQAHQILAMDRILPGATEDKVKALLNDEVRAVVNLYLGGKIRQWYFRQDRPGAILVLEVDNQEEAEKLLAGLPLSRAGLLAYDLIPIGPYVPLATMIPPEGPQKRKKR